MTPHKLLLLFSSLQKHEVHRLRKFLQSPYHNQREDVHALYEYLRAWPWKSGVPQDEQLYSAACPEKPFDIVQLRLVMSYLYKRIESFLVNEALQETPFEQEMILLQFYSNRGLSRGFQDTLRNSEKHLNNSTSREANYFYQQFRVLESKFTTPSERSDTSYQQTLQQLTDSLDYFYLFSKLKYACGILTHQQLFNVQYETRMMEGVEQCVIQEKLWEIPAIGIYFFAYKMLAEPEGGPWFEKLLEKIRSEASVLLAEEVKPLYLLAINFCIRQVNLGQQDWRKQLFGLYLEALEKGYLLEGEELLPWAYKNIISIGLKVKAFDQVEQLVDQYKDRLPAEHRDAFYRYGRAELHLSLGNFSKVAETLGQVQFKDPLMALNARITLIKAYFELGEYDLIEYQLDSFKHFLKRKEMLSYHRENYKRFATYCLGLIQLASGLNNESNLEKRKTLHKAVQETQKLVGKEWLMEKLK